MKFKGAITAIVTPFKKDFSLDLEALRKLTRWQVDEGIDGIVVCGSTGEAATQNDEEYARTVECVVEEVAGKVPVIAGAGSNNTSRAVELSRIAMDQGVDALLHVTPYYNKPTPNGIVGHFKAIAAATNLPIILYNVPGRTGSNVSPSTIIRVAKEIPSVVGVKEASGNINQMGEIIAGAPEGFVFLSGDDSLTLPSMILGGRGVISVASNEAPKLMSRLCRAALERRWDEARRLHFKLLPLMNINFIESNPIPVKTALAMMGKISESFRLPLVALEDKNRPVLKKVLKELELV